MKLPTEIRKRINRFSHAAGLAHAEQVRARLLVELESRLASGESIASLSEYLERGTADGDGIRGRSSSQNEKLARTALESNFSTVSKLFPEGET